MKPKDRLAQRIFDKAPIDTETPLTAGTTVVIRRGKVFAVTDIQGDQVAITDGKNTRNVSRALVRTLDELHDAPVD